MAGAEWVPPTGGVTVPSGSDRFAEIVARFADVIRDYQACGFHVHVAAADLETAVAVVNHVRRWLPVLLALSVNFASTESGRADAPDAAKRLNGATPTPARRR